MEDVQASILLSLESGKLECNRAAGRHEKLVGVKSYSGEDKWPLVAFQSLIVCC